MLETVLHIVLSILAFLGSALLILLGLFILIFLLFMFVPIRYYGDFSRDDTSMLIQARISWLLRFFQLKITYEKQPEVKAYLLFFKVFDLNKPRKEKKNKTAKATPKPLTESQAKDVSSPDDAWDNMDETPSDKMQDDSPTNISESNTEEPFTKEKKSLFAKIKENLQNIWYKIKSIYAKIMNVLQNIRYYIELLKEEETKQVFRNCKTRLFKILKSIRPRKFNADLEVGTGAPDTTGYVLAGAGMLYPYLGNYINIVPNFDEAVFKGQIHLKGKITLFVILINALKILLDKELRRLINKLKREEP